MKYASSEVERNRIDSLDTALHSYQVSPGGSLADGREHKYRCPFCNEKKLYGKYDSASGNVALTCHHCVRSNAEQESYFRKLIDFLSVSDANVGMVTKGPERKKEKKLLPNEERKHVYQDEHGNVIATKTIRPYMEIDPVTGESKRKKDVIWSHEEDGKTVYNGGGGQELLFNLPEIASAPSDMPLHFFEGEKDAATGKNVLKVLSTSCPNGGRQKNWIPEWDRYVTGRDIVIVTDNDTDGESHGRFVADNVMRAGAKSAKIVPASAIYNEVQEKDDITDILAKLGPEETCKRFTEAVASATPFDPVADMVNTRLKGFDIGSPISEEEIVEPKFLWYPYIMRGEVNVVMGNSGTGKTSILMRICADLSNGTELPTPDETLLMKEPPKPMRILYMSGEEDRGLLGARLKCCGANLKNIIVIGKETSSQYTFDDVSNAGLFDALLTANNSPDLVVIDPWTHFAPTVDINRANLVRKVISDIAASASKHNCAVVIMSHVSKMRQTENINYSAIGSVELVNRSRSALFAINLREPGEENSRVLIHTKVNYGRTGTSLQYKYHEKLLPGHERPIGYVEWAGIRPDVTSDVVEEAGRHKRSVCDELNSRNQTRDDDVRIIDIFRQLAPKEYGKKSEYTNEELATKYGADLFGAKMMPKIVRRTSMALRSEGIQVEARAILSGKARGVRITRIDLNETVFRKDKDDGIGNPFA